MLLGQSQLTGHVCSVELGQILLLSKLCFKFLELRLCEGGARFLENHHFFVMASPSFGFWSRGGCKEGERLFVAEITAY